MKTSNLIAIILLVFNSFSPNAQPVFRAATSEFFIEIPPGARYTVTIGDETISSRNGRFRFFDLPSGRLPVEIALNNRLIVRSDVFAKPGIRSIAVLNRNSLSTIKDLELGQCNLGNWDQILEDNYPESRPSHRRSYEREIYLPVMSPEAFSNFITSLRKTPFSKDKLGLIDLTVGYSYFTVSQIKQVITMMTFSDEKFEALEKMSPHMADSENAYDLIESFRFSDDKENARSIILAGKSQRKRR
jgi:hypothetical protein